MATSSELHPEEPLSETDIHGVLSNERRSMVIALLSEKKDECLSARELSERIAALETGESPPPRNVRQSVYVTLQQTHLPKLNRLGIVDYDPASKCVTLAERARQVSVYMEVVPKYGLAWSEYYFAVALLGLLTVVAAGLGVPGLSQFDGVVWASVFFVVVMLSAAYQTATRRSSVFHRLKE